MHGIFTRLIVLMSVFLTGGGSLLAQVTYQQTDYAQAGESFVYSEATAIPGLGYSQAGDSIDWDFSVLTPNNQRTQEFEDPDQAGYRLEWIAACIFQTVNPIFCNNQWNSQFNLASRSLGDEGAFAAFLPIQLSDQTTHSSVENNLLIDRMLGLSVGTTLPLQLTINYTQPDTVLQFPLAYQNVDSSFAAYDIDFNALNSDIGYYTSYQRINEVEGRGSLTTPFGAYPSVLKLKTTLIREDSIQFGPDSSVVIPRKQVFYSWYDPAQGVPVVTASGLVVAGIPVINSVEYLDTLRCLDPTALFVALPNPVLADPANAPFTVNFTSLSTNADSLFWDFDNGAIGNSSIVSTDYNSPGTYNVSLVACNNTTCSPPSCDTFTLPILILDTTTVAANFNIIGGDSACVGSSIQFFNTSFNAETFAWDFGDGTTSTMNSPSHTYQTEGNFTVQLIAQGTSNSDTLEREIIILGAPTASATTDSTVLEAGNSTQLNANASGTDISYSWTPTAGLSCVDCPNPIATPDSTTTYTVRVENGCGENSSSIDVIVNQAVGIISLSEWSLSIFPNPSSGIFTISYEASSTLSWQVIDLQGRMLSSGTDTQIDLSPQPTGLYLLRLSDGENQAHIRLQKR